MIQPPFLAQNDCIAIVATARSVQIEAIEEAQKLLKAKGFEVKTGNSIGLINHQFAGTDEERASDFENQLKDPKVKAIWCAKGGYGSARIIDLIDWNLLVENPKWVIGYSDVTAILGHIFNLGLQSLHAQMPVGIADKSKASFDSLIQRLRGEKNNYQLPHNSFNSFGKASGKLIGGNLSVLYSIIGTKSFPDFQNNILFIEDLDEYLYHIDRMMQNFKRNGLLTQLNGIIVGGMTEMNDNQIPFGKNAIEIIYTYTKDLHIPVAFDFPAGHVYDNQALVIGCDVQLEVKQKGSLVLFGN